MLTRQLLALSRQQAVVLKAVNLNHVLTDLEKMLQRLIREDIELVTRLDPRIGDVHADPGQLEQVVMNLIVNARDAMPRGGRVTIETSNVDLSESYTRTHLGVRPGPYVNDPGDKARDSGNHISVSARPLNARPAFGWRLCLIPRRSANNVLLPRFVVFG